MQHECYALGTASSEPQRLARRARRAMRLERCKGITRVHMHHGRDRLVHDRGVHGRVRRCRVGRGWHKAHAQAVHLGGEAAKRVLQLGGRYWCMCGPRAVQPVARRVETRLQQHALLRRRHREYLRTQACRDLGAAQRHPRLRDGLCRSGAVIGWLRGIQRADELGERIVLGKVRSTHRPAVADEVGRERHGPNRVEAQEGEREVRRARRAQLRQPLT